MARQELRQVAASGMVEVTIARGTYQPTKDSSYGPGSVVSVDAAEAAYLKRVGIVRPDDYVDPAEVQDGKLTISAAEGPTVASIGIA